MLLLLLLLFKYYPEEKHVECLLLKWNEKMFQIDLNSDLKEEPDLKSRRVFTLLEPYFLNRTLLPGSWICLNPNVSKYSSKCVTLWICLNMSETVRAQISKSSKYVWICSIKIQNIHELLLSSIWNWLNMSAVLNMPQ